jgi:hypothetical protein
MTDILIRDVPDDVVSSIEEKAKRLGLSRTEYLRRRMTAWANVSDEPVTRESWAQFAELTQDLRDPAVMKGAWE